MKYAFLILALFASFSTFAASEDLIISIEKTIPVRMVKKAVKDLNVIDPTLGQCYFQASVEMFSDYSAKPAEPYFGVAIVRLSHECAEERRASYIKKIMKDKRYKIWSNPEIEGTPSVSGGNRIGL